MNPLLEQGLRELMARAAAKINRTQFGQEPQYTAAFFGNLAGEKIIDPTTGEFLELTCSISDDRGRNSGEKRTGIDIGMVVRWEDPVSNNVFEKAVLAQAKNRLNSASSTVINDLNEKCERMAGITPSYFVLDCPYDGSVPSLKRPQTGVLWGGPLIALDDYLINTVFPCQDGDTRDEVIEVAKRADRTITLTTNGPKPRPKKARRARRV